MEQELLEDIKSTLNWILVCLGFLTGMFIAFAVTIMGK